MRENSENSAPSRGNGASVDEIIAAAAETRRKLSNEGYSPGARKPPQTAFDVWTALDILVRRWHWLFLGGLLFAAGFFLLGWHFVKPKYTATAQLLRFETPGERDFFTEVLSSETFSALLRSPELLQTVGAYAAPPIPPEKIVKFTKVEPEPDSDMVKIVLAGREPSFAVGMVNHYASNAVQYTRDFFAQRAQIVAAQYLKKELEQMDQDIKVLDDKFRNLHLPPELSLKLSHVSGAVSAMSNNLAAPKASVAMINRQRERLDIAMSELNDLLAKYTEIHPAVQAKQAQVQQLETAMNEYVANAPTNVSWSTASAPRGTTRPGDAGYNPETDIVLNKLRALEEGRMNLNERYRQAELYAEQPPGVVRVFAPATLQNVQNNKRPLKVAAVTLFGGFVGVFATLLLIALVEVTDGRLRTSDDVKRVTRLPVLTTLGNLRDMNADQRAQWAFRTWTMLQGRLSPSANHGLVCGIASSEASEGRTTWIRLLAEAASMTGFRVLTIATKPSPTHLQLTNGKPAPRKPDATKPANGKSAAPASPGNGHPESLTTALTPSVLSAPDQVTQQLTDPNSQPMVHIPLPGWVWNLERRRQWGEALNQWKQIDNLVILVELPPSSVPESVLLGSNLPNLLWLTNSGTAKAGTTRAQIETLRHARCNIVGAVLNRETTTPMRKRFPRWLGVLPLLAALSLGSAQAQITTTSPGHAAPTPTEQLVRDPGFSITRPTQRAAWQQKLTLGPGDVLNFGLFGAPEYSRADVAIGPDGRVSFLEAQDLMAAGLTIDELRARMDESIGQYRRSARTIITPVAFRSKKYYVLGKVMTKGVYTLDRPLTVVEAIARAHGLENGLVDRNVVDLADFQRSFLIRNGKRIPLNFEKLFAEGDLSQNMPIEPGDYLYFASADIREVYVVGEIRLPGPATYNPDLTILDAITTRGGFTERAFKSRVLVIRGPLDAPERIIVDTADIITGRSLNFKLQPRDIVFVNSRPFIRVEELADLAATAFLQSLITSWVGVDVVKPIN